MGTDRTRALPTLLTLLALLLVVLAAASAGALSADPVLDARVQQREQPVPSPTATVEPVEPENAAEPHVIPGDLLLGALVVLLVGALALLVRFVLRVRRRSGSRSQEADQRHTGTPEVGIVQAETHPLTAWAEETRTALSSGGTTSDVVIRCWLDLERRCAAAGLVRGPSRTTSAFAAAAAASPGLPARPLSALHRLYQRARFGGSGAASASAALTPAARAPAAARVEELAAALGPAPASRANGTTP
ncbi:hypothetical protein AC792_15560 [Arthrobacter sp. RIT-PI-e]|uniref:DUF4129 domain-containing protein n=1 Tax=Arthrobacter sp. RIT-PI-e TaxID=1681197 RepID=UPI000675D757|nr:DUF4129 domain-containing protein [Arthrobacter sp. RIT-PI-e]KNC14674.1 hypothetical protein AC792_15560 [Arthrobacter sp. RIT-PI-e]